MRVAMYYRNNDVRVEEMPVPKIGKGELLVKVMASGICGSDVMEWYRIKKAPRVLGHEIAGEIVEVGEGVRNYKKATGYLSLIMFLAIPAAIALAAIIQHAKPCIKQITTPEVLQSISECLR